MRLRPMWRLRNLAARYSSGTRALAISGGYAAVVACVAVFVIVAGLMKPGSLAGVWLAVVTLPSSLFLRFIPVQGLAYALILTLGGLAQAWLAWRLLRGQRVSMGQRE